MKVNNPYGGFLIAMDTRSNLADKAERLLQSGAKVHIIDADAVLLAAWDEFQGQGLWQSEGHCSVAYDTELSNESDLKQQLGIDSSRAMDIGELLWLLYKSYGNGMLDRLRGSFCFSLWDEREKRLLVATDPFGLRPVVYKKTANLFVAASRIKHLLWSNYGDKRINNDAIFHYLFFQAVCSPLTIYNDIFKLDPGNGFVVTNKKSKSFAYYDIVYHTDESKTEKDWIKLIPQELEKAVNLYAATLPYEQTGCFLSGGTDSSSIVGFYTKLLGKPAKTFSIGFNEARYNELDYANIAVEHYKALQKEYYVTPNDVLSLISFLPDIYDEPFGNASVIPAFFCSKCAKGSGVNFLLGGDGGDEIFGGNERYVTNLIFQRYLDLPEFFRKSIFEPLLSLMPSKGLFYKAKRYVRRSNIKNPERFYSYNLLAETDLSEIFNSEFVFQINPESFMNIAKRHYDHVSYSHETNRLLYLDMKFTITDNDIRKVTPMVEAAGLRVRYPFLDRDLVDFTSTIPADMKVKWGKNRYIFKKAMEGILPHEIIHKSKHGMGLPIDPWFKKDKNLREILTDNLIGGQPKIFEYIQKDFIKNIFKLHKEADTPYYGDNLWVFLMLELWLKQNTEQ